MSINFQLISRLLKFYVWSTLLYRAEAWTLNVDMLKKLEDVVYKKDTKALIYGTCYK